MDTILAKKNLLIVDDEVEIQQILGGLLEPAANQIRFASNGEQALAVMSKEPVDAILCDLRMPGMNGLELLRSLRELNIQTPFVFLTGYADPSTMTEAMKLGVRGFLEKPFKSEHLVAVMNNVLDVEASPAFDMGDTAMGLLFFDFTALVLFSCCVLQMGGPMSVFALLKSLFGF